MATRVSCGFAEMTISFDIYTPHGASDGAAPPASAGKDDSLDSARRAAQERLIRLCDCFPHRCLPDLKIEFPACDIARLGFLPKFGLLSLLQAGSIDETTHANVHHESQCQTYKGCGGSSVTHQRQRNSSYRHVAYHH